MVFSVTWDSHLVHPNGQKRSKPPASTMHGWLAKMRGTLSGNETVRSRGIREMKEAAAARKYYKENPKARSIRGSSSLGFSFFRRSKPSAAPKRANTATRIGSGTTGVTHKPSTRSTSTPRRSASGHSTAHRSASGRSTSRSAHVAGQRSAGVSRHISTSSRRPSNPPNRNASGRSRR